MAEIVEEADKSAENHLKETEEENQETEKVLTQVTVELNRDNLLKAFGLFAGRQKVSIMPLIKLLIPELTGKQVNVTMTKQQEEFIGDIKIDWQAFLKQYFNDPEITLLFTIDEKANTKRQAYTAAEQFEEMLGENELFRKMVNQFRLKLKQ